MNDLDYPIEPGSGFGVLSQDCIVEISDEIKICV